jgi:hypothetical protein
MNIIKKMREAKNICYRHGQRIGSVRKIVNGTFGKTMYWAFYDNDDHLIGTRPSLDEAFSALVSIR